MNNLKVKKIWTSKELKRLQNLCAKCHSFQELGKKVAKSFPKRTRGSVQSQACQHKDWINHFEKNHVILLTKKERKLPEILKAGPKTLKEVSNALDVPKEDVFPIRDKFVELGYNIEIKKGAKETVVSLISEPSPDKGKNEKPAKITNNVIKVLFISDICFGLKTQQPALLETAYKIGEEAGVFFAVIAGNIVAGKPQKAKEKDYFLLTAEEQLDYAIKHIPKASFKTTFINGPRDLSWEAGEDGINIGEALAKAREDLSCKDDLKTTLSIGKKEKVKIGVMCASGSDPYTKSYTLQGISENLQEAEYYVFEHSDPLQMILMGGTHTAILDPRRFPLKGTRINDFDKVAIPALHRIPSSQAVSKKRGGSHVLGCVIVSFELNDEGYLKNPPVCEFYNLTAYFKENDYLLHPTGELADKSLDKEEQDLLNLLTDKPRRKGSLSRRMKISEVHVDEIKKGLNEKKINVEFNESSKSLYWQRALQEEFKPLDAYISQFFPKNSKTKKAKVVGVSDTHLGHKHERPDLIKEAYDVAEAEQADAILHSGDVFEGEDSYKGQVRELAYVGADAQRDHGLEIWPASKIPTFLIMGSSHEKIFLDKCGYDIVSNFARLANAEKGLNLTALVETLDGSSGSRGIVDINGIKFCLDHPSGGIPYGRSYRPQKMIENLVSEMELSGEAKVILIGHLHVSLFMLYKGVAGFNVPCLQDKTKYIEAKGYTPWLGIWVVEVNMDEYENITRIVPKYIPYEPKKQREAYHVVKKDK
ncbi:MAG: hypothetical protein Q8N42_00595 [bacterium]|nr:hypothetical protein [bacterium]